LVMRAELNCGVYPGKQNQIESKTDDKTVK